jgi:23S rRNA (uracil1939-C5)-methyltransferase
MKQTIELTLDGIAHGGEAIGRYDGKAIFVPYAIPGERVRVEIVEEKERWARARLLEVLDPSSDRIAPPCPYFGPDRCGGCQWQHIAYERQAELKAEIVADQLRRLGRIANPAVVDTLVLADPQTPNGEADSDDYESAPPALAPERSTGATLRSPAGNHGPHPEITLLDFGYRNHIRFDLTTDGRLGFRQADGGEIIPIDRCLLLHERLDELHAALDVAWPELTAVSLRTGINTGQGMILMETAGEDLPELEIDVAAACVVLTARGIQPLIGEPWTEEEVAGRRYRVSAESFFPANTVGAEALVEVVRSYVDLRPTDVLLDVGCGVGLFALALAEFAAEVIGIEASPAACEDFAHNAGDLPHISLHEGAVSDVLPALRAQGQHVDVAVMVPLRTGAGEAVIGEVAAFRPRRIVYVASDPATLARDGIHLAAAGYRLVEAQPVDTAPQTAHVETVACWEKQ